MSILRRVREINNALRDSKQLLIDSNEQLDAMNGKLDIVQPKLEKAIASAKELNELLNEGGIEEEGESLEAETAAKEGLQKEITRLQNMSSDAPITGPGSET